MNGGVKVCPFCDLGDIEIFGGDAFPACYVICECCGAQGPIADSLEIALEKWNERP